MKRIFTIIMLVLGISETYAQTMTVPNTGTGGSSFLGPLSTGARSYQMLIDASQLTAIVGMEITGISFRGTSSAGSWPASAVNITDYDIYLGPCVAPSAKSNTFSANYTGPLTTVRTGSLAIAANAYPAGAVFGPVIMFDAPYQYTGGNMLIEIRHSGTGTSKSVDAISSGSLYGASWGSGYTSAGTSNGNFAVVQINYQASPLPVKLIDFSVDRKEKDVLLNWSTSATYDNDRFEVQRSTDGKNFMTIAVVPNAGNGEMEKQYNYTDKNTEAEGIEYIYYRLTMIDYNGAVSYSKVMKLNIRDKATVMASVSPNPVKNQATVLLNSEGRESVFVIITNIKGQVVKSENYILKPGTNSLPVDMTAYPSGIYNISIKGTGIKEQIKLVKE